MEEKIYQLFEYPGDRIILTLSEKTDREEMENPEYHHKMQITLVTRGSGSIRTGYERTFDVEAGDVILYDSMQAHQLYFIDPKEGFDTISVEFDIRGFITEEFVVFDSSDLEKLFIKLHNGDCLIKKDFRGAKKIGQTISNMLDEFREEKRLTHHVVRAQMILIYTYLLQYYDEISDGVTETMKKRNAAIEKVMLYINQNLSENITLEELAEIANMNKTYFSTTFKRVTGKTVWDYILNMRIELAISYIVTEKSKYNITEIAEMCGFNNAANFNKAFKKITGKTPTEFKKTKYSLCFPE